MSANDPINLKQDRRQWLKTTVLGAAVLPLTGAATETLQTPPQSAPTTAAGAPPVGNAEGKAGAHFFTRKPKVEFSLPSVLGVGGCDEHKVK